MISCQIYGGVSKKEKKIQYGWNCWIRNIEVPTS